MSSRYSFSIQIQPVRLIPLSVTDDYVTFGHQDRIDKLAYQYYNDATMGWVIMAANPTYFHEFDISTGDKIRIPLPLDRVYKYLGITGSSED